MVVEWLSYLVLAGFVAALVYGMWRKARSTKFNLVQLPLMVINHTICRMMWRLQIDGAFPKREKQGYLIVCNHRSPFDPWFIGCALDEMAHWMVASEYCEHPLFAFILKQLQVIPTRRTGVDTNALKQAIRYAQQGQLVGLLPEGRINISPQILLPGRPGVALLALRARVPVVPCYVEGAPYDGTILNNLFKPARVRLKIGQPFDISTYYDRAGDRQVLEEVTKLLLSQIAQLGGQPNFVPQIAGKKWLDEKQ